MELPVQVKVCGITNPEIWIRWQFRERIMLACWWKLKVHPLLHNP